MKKTLVLAGLTGSLLFAGSASAAFVGWDAKTYIVESGGNTFQVLDIYGTFDAPTSVVNVFQVKVSYKDSNGNAVSPLFHHSDIAGGSWAPQFVTNAAIDTFLSIGMSTGFTSPVQADPNFGPLGFNNGGQVIPAQAGWFNSNPPTNVGATAFDEDFGLQSVFVGRFVIKGGFEDVTMNWFARQTSGTAQNPDQEGGEGSFTFAVVPAPGAIALLGLAGLAGTRRRRA